MKTTTAPIPFAFLLSLVAAPLAAGWEDGVAAFQAGRYQEAADLFRTVVDRSPDAPQGHYMLGLSLLHAERGGDAREPLEKALAMTPGQISYRMAVARAQLADSDPDAALATLDAGFAGEIAVAQQPAYSRLLATAAVAGSEGEAALAVLERALASDPASKALWLAKARVAQDLADPAASFQALAGAFELDPQDLEVGRKAIGTAFDLTRDDDDGRLDWYREAARIALRLVEVEPSAAHHTLAGEALMGSRDYAAAGRRFEQALELEPGDAKALYYVASCELAEGRAASALDHFETALASSPGDQLRPRILTAQAGALRHLERFEEAAAAYRALGDEARAAEIDELIEIREDNRRWDADKKRCEQKKAEVDKLLQENDYLEGTEAWRKLIATTTEALADCQPYLSE